MADTKHIQLAHGGGGQLTSELIEEVILPSLGEASTQDAGGLADAAILTAAPGERAEQLALTTDSYVVQPLEFPGGDIGKLAICGTVNDLAAVGARVIGMTFALVLEEGLELALLRRVLASAGEAARQAGAKIVTGDTKVVERGGVSGMVINTAGVGRVMAGAQLGFGQIQEGDKLIISGTLGEHGLAVMSLRKGLNFWADLKSDCAPLNGLAQSLVTSLGGSLRFMRDPTRGGLAAAVVDIAQASRRTIVLQERAIPVHKTARAAAEMLGLDLMTIANEGKMLAVVAADAAQKALALLKENPLGRDAAIIGTVGQGSDVPLVEMHTAIGGRRVVQMPYGEELPRIC